MLTLSILLLTSYELRIKETKRVLAITALDPTNPEYSRMDDGIRAVLETSPDQIELYHEYLETVLFPDAAKQEQFGNSIIAKYIGRNPDRILAVGLSALRFVNEIHQGVFSAAPVVFCGVVELFAGDLKLNPQFTGVPQPARIPQPDLELRPQTCRVVIVAGTSKMDRLGENWVKESLVDRETNVQLTYLSDLTMPDLVDWLRQLRRNSIVLNISFAQGVAGRRFIDVRQSVPMIALAADLRMFVNKISIESKQYGRTMVRAWMPQCAESTVFSTHAD